MGYYKAKFIRESKEHPSDWAIVPAGNGTFRLIKVR